MSTQQIIVYRSQFEQAQDQFWMDNIGLIFPVIAGSAVSLFVWVFLQGIMSLVWGNYRRRPKFVETGANVIAVVSGFAVFIKMTFGLFF